MKIGLRGSGYKCDDSVTASIRWDEQKSVLEATSRDKQWMVELDRRETADILRKVAQMLIEREPHPRG